jgi:hypothetical protein
MKRLLSVSLLILFLSFPTFGGHVVIGGTYCDCKTPGCVEDYPGECSGEPGAASQQNDSPCDATAELGILIVALLFWLRLKA